MLQGNLMKVFDIVGLFGYRVCLSGVVLVKFAFMALDRSVASVL
jgi:hypothetical protein